MVKKVVKDFTVIDFWGIWTPGIIFMILIVPHVPDPYSKLLEALFGRSLAEIDELWLVLFLLLAGYVVGLLIHEIGDFIEKMVFKLLLRLIPRFDFLSRFSMRQRAYLSLPESKRHQIQEKLQRELGGLDFDLADQRNIDQRNMKMAMDHIRTKLDLTGNSKQRLFDSFRTMSRNFVTVLAIFTYLYSSHFFPSSIILIIAIFFERYVHYSYLKYKYAFESWLEV